MTPDHIGDILRFEHNTIVPEHARKINRTPESVEGLIKAFAQAKRDFQALEATFAARDTVNHHSGALQEETQRSHIRHSVTNRRIPISHTAAYDRQPDPFEGSPSPIPIDSQPVSQTRGQKRCGTHTHCPTTECK